MFLTSKILNLLITCILDHVVHHCHQIRSNLLLVIIIDIRIFKNYLLYGRVVETHEAVEYLIAWFTHELKTE